MQPHSLLKMNKAICTGWFFFFFSHQSTDIHPGWQWRRDIWGGPTACVIDNCCTVAACLPSPPWPANSSSITGRSGWWLMSAPVSDRARLCAFCCSQTAWYCSQIWLISVVTVQLLNLASKKGKMLFEKPYPTDCFQRSLKVLPPCDAVSVFFPCHIKKVQYAIISSEETTILMWCQRQLQYILCWRDVYWS